MSLFRAFVRRRALQRYARDLPRRLAHDYGAAACFTPAQIAAAAGRLKLDPRWIGHGYAMFLPAAAFAALPAEQRGPLPYDEARAAVARYANRPPPASGWEALHDGTLGSIDSSTAASGSHGVGGHDAP